MKNSIALSAKDLGRFIGDADIDIMPGKVPAAPDRNVSVVHASNIDNPSGENLQTENFQVILFTFTTCTETVSVVQFLRCVNLSA
jgi:hypothetical protein